MQGKPFKIEMSLSEAETTRNGLQAQVDALSAQMDALTKKATENGQKVDLSDGSPYVKLSQEAGRLVNVLRQYFG